MQECTVMSSEIETLLDQDAFVIVGDDKLEMDDLDAASRDDIIQKNEAVLLKNLIQRM